MKNNKAEKFSSMYFDLNFIREIIRILKEKIFESLIMFTCKTFVKSKSTSAYKHRQHPVNRNITENVSCLNPTIVFISYISFYGLFLVCWDFFVEILRFLMKIARFLLRFLVDCWTPGDIITSQQYIADRILRQTT